MDAGFGRAGWRALGIGAGAALVIGWFPFLDFIFTPILTLVHELGHTAAGWLFGRPSIPAFDFTHGGGVTMSQYERDALVVAGIVGLWGWGVYAVRGRPRAIAALIGVAVAYGFAVGGNGEAFLYYSAGHGFELLFAAIFLFRGLTGWGCQNELERPLSCFLGVFMLIHELRFAWGLVFDSVQRAEYQIGKAGLISDLIRVQWIFYWKLESVARLLVVVTLATLPATILVARFRHSLVDLLERETSIEL